MYVGVEGVTGGIIGALMVATIALNKGTAMVDEGTISGPAEATDAVTSAATGMTPLHKYNRRGWRRNGSNRSNRNRSLDRRWSQRQILKT